MHPARTRYETGNDQHSEYYLNNRFNRGRTATAPYQRLSAPDDFCRLRNYRNNHIRTFRQFHKQLHRNRTLTKQCDCTGVVAVVRRRVIVRVLTAAVRLVVFRIDVQCLVNLRADQCRIQEQDE